MVKTARAATSTGHTDPSGDANASLAARNAELERHVHSLEHQLQTLQHQLEWFKRQLFGRSSEKRLLVDPAHQPLLAGLVHAQAAAPAPELTEHIAYERRRRKQRGDACVTDEGLRFDASVPVETIELCAPQLEGPEADDYEIIAFKRTRRLAQRPASYVVLEAERPPCLAQLR